VSGRAVVTPPEAGLAPRTVRVVLQPEWAERGLLASDARTQALRKALVQHPGVRHIVGEHISFDGTVEPAVLETVAAMLRQASWLVVSVSVE
jgi:hypothetical protein